MSEWRPVDGFPGYEVSDLGEVRGKSGRILKPFTVTSGHVAVGLYAIPGHKVTRNVHVLVARAFIGPCPDGLEVRHLDGVHRNNVLANLRYGTRSENQRDAVRHGTNWNVAKTHCPHGHPYSPENTYNRPDRRTGRLCRTCIKNRERAGRAPLERA